MRKNGDGSPQKSTATSDGVVLRSARSSFRALSNCLRMISSGASTVARSAALAVSSAVNQDGESLHEQKVLWAGFDTLEKEDGYTRRVLLLAFRSGFQVWDVEDKENVHLIVSGHDGQAFFMQMVPKPMHSLDDRFSESRPLLAVCGDSSWEENSSGRSSSESSDNPTNVYAYSLKSQSYVHTLKFRSTVYTVRCSSRIVAVLQAAQIHCFDATTLEMDYTIVTNSIVCSFLGVGYGPLAVGPRWIAYSGSRIANSTSPVFTPELISLSSSPIVAQFARESSKQLAFLEVLPNPYIPGLKGIGVVNDNVPDADSIGMVIIKDIISKSVIAQFKAHKSPISALCFDPSGMLLVTASIQGHNINVFRIMPSISTGSDGNTTSFAHLFRLQRGFTNAVIQDISFNSDSNLIVVSSLRGTSHLFEINPEREGNSPIPLSAINKIRSGNSSGGIGITSTFFCCDEQNNKNYYGSVSDDSHKTNLLVFAPSGRMTEYALWADPVGVGHETAAMTVFDFESGLETEGKVAVEPIRRWPMIQNQSRRETKDHHSDIYGSGTTVDSKSKVFPEVVRKQNVEKSWRGTTRVEDKRQLYISEAELQTHLPYQLPLWARRKFRFQEMVLNRNEESCGGGEMEIEGIQTRTIEARTRDLIPVWGYLHSPISQHVTRESAQISSNITQGDQVAPLEGHGAKTDLGVVHKEEESSKSEEEIQELQRWSYIELGVTKLIKILEEEPDQAFGSEQYINLYSTIYDMCTQSTRRNYPKQLYKKYRKVLEVYTNNTVLPSLRKKHGEFLLREFVKRWDNHKIMVGCLSHCFFYLDCYYVLRRSLPTLKEVGLTSFYKLVYQEMQSKAKDVVLTLIQKEREGEQIDRALLKNVIDVFVENGMGEMLKYEKDFESFMLQDTASYYSSKASRWIQEDSCPEYMLKYEECLKKEKERVTHYLHSITEPKLVEKVQNELLVVVAKRLLENEHSGCRALLRDDKVDDLSKMYKLYHTIPQGLEPVADIFKQHITFLIKQAEDAAAAADQGLSTGGVQGQVFIRKVIELHEKYMVYVSVCFQNHTLFHKALNGAFKTFCNKTVAGRSTAELLATFCNNIVKNGGSDEDIEASLENVVNMLDYLTDQDLFAQFYWRKLARRLLSDHNGSDEHEIILFTKLKQKIGSLYPCKMEAMMRDVTLAREIQNASTDYLNLKTRINFTVTVLTTGLWPSYEKSDLNLPTEMVDCVKVFESYYEKRTEKRKLSWIHLLGTCHIIGSFEQKRIELVVSTYQAAVLLLFNDTERLSYTEILQQLKLSHEHLVCVLHSLSCAKYKILLKEPISRTISKTDTFEFNFKFTDRVKKIKVHLPSMDERKKIIQDADRDRRYEIEAAVVRIMKNKKVLPHQQLVQECVELLRGSFKPCIAMMNTRIEALISRDYLERDSEDPDVLNYVA